MNLTWTETFDHAGRTYWATEVGKYRMVITHDPQIPAARPFHGNLNADYGYGWVFVESGEYKTLASAQAGLKRRAAKYGI